MIWLLAWNVKKFSRAQRLSWRWIGESVLKIKRLNCIKAMKI